MIIRYRPDPKNPRRLTPDEARALDAAPIDYSDIPPLDDIDWSQSADVERTPGKVSGAWCVKGTRIPVQAIIDNSEDFTPEEIAREIYDLDVDMVRRILAYAQLGPT